MSEGMIFSFQGTLYSSGLLPVWGVALAVTIVYLKTECLFRMHSFRFLGFFSCKKQQNRKLSFRFYIDTFDFLTTKKKPENTLRLPIDLLFDLNLHCKCQKLFPQRFHNLLLVIDLFTECQLSFGFNFPKNEVIHRAEPYSMPWRYFLAFLPRR